MDAHTVGIVDHRPGVVPPGHGQEVVERTRVAVHAEGAVADDQLAGGFTGDFAKLGVQIRHVPVLEPGKRRPADPATVEERCVVEPVLEYEVANAQEGVDDPDVGGIATAVEQRPGPARERGQGLFEFLVGSGVAADQVRGTAAGAPTLDAALEGRADAGVAGKPQVVVAAEVEQRSAVDDDLAALRALEISANAVHVPTAKIVEATLQVIESLAVAHARWCLARIRCGRITVVRRARTFGTTMDAGRDQPGRVGATLAVARAELLCVVQLPRECVSILERPKGAPGRDKPVRYGGVAVM